MTLSTVDEDGWPDARVLILKDVDAKGWHFACTKESAKGRQIAANPHVALTFYWQPLGRQVRIRGAALEMSAERRDADFLARPIGSRACSLLARQSDILVGGDEELDCALNERSHQIQLDPSVISPKWAVFAVRPTEIEFWQASEQRRHVRLGYRMFDDAWIRERLWP